MRYILLIASLTLANLAYTACPIDKTCVTFEGVTELTNDKVIPVTQDVHYTIQKGIKGGPYVSVGGISTKPSAALLSVQVSKSVAPTNCFVVTATTDINGSLVTSSNSVEVCSRLKPPTEVGLQPPTETGVE